MRIQKSIWPIVVTLLLVCAASCTQTDTTDDAVPVPLAFATAVSNPATRAGDATTDNLTTMGVFAYYTKREDYVDGQFAPNYMYNELMMRIGNSWTYSPMKYWPNMPGEKISFFAYAPHNSTMAPGGLGTWPLSDTKGSPTFYFSNPVEADVDLLLASRAGAMNRTQAAGTVRFTFYHMLTKVIFKVQSEEPVVIDKIRINNASTAGRVEPIKLAWDKLEVDGKVFEASPKQSVSANTLTQVATFYMIPVDDLAFRGITFDLLYTKADGAPRSKTGVALPSGVWTQGEVMAYTLEIKKEGLTVTSTNGGGISWGGDGSNETIEGTIN